MFSYVWLYATLWTVAHLAPLSIGFSQQECWNGLPFLPPGDLPDPEIKPSLLYLLHCRWIIYHWATGEVPVVFCTLLFTWSGTRLELRWRTLDIYNNKGGFWVQSCWWCKPHSYQSGGLLSIIAPRTDSWVAGPVCLFEDQGIWILTWTLSNSDVGDTCIKNAGLEYNAQIY